jgi:murein DD-endopeptidase MepM/ murein hydrolase activator NlpD
MDNHFTITINDDHGVKQYNLHQFIKKVIWYVLLFVTIIGLSAVGSILYLNSEVDNIAEKRIKTQASYIKLKNTNIELATKTNNAQIALEIKKKELSEVSDSLSEIETLIGLTPVPDMSLQERVNLTKVSSEHVAALMQFVPSGSPIEFKGITSKFGFRQHPKLHKRAFHRGLDMRAHMKTPLYATADAIVEWAGFHKKSGFGRLIILQHNYGFRTYFGHLNKIVIKSGQFVKKGELIAYTGNSGLSSGPHLHYEIRFKRKVIDPFRFVKWNINNYKDIFKQEKEIPWQSLIKATAHIQVQTRIQTQQ